MKKWGVLVGIVLVCLPISVGSIAHAEWVKDMVEHDMVERQVSASVHGSYVAASGEFFVSTSARASIQDTETHESASASWGRTFIQKFKWINMGPPSPEFSGVWSVSYSGSCSLDDPHEPEAHSSAGSGGIGLGDSIVTGLPEDPRTSYSGGGAGRYYVDIRNSSVSQAVQPVPFSAGSSTTIPNPGSERYLGIVGAASASVTVTVSQPSAP